MLSRSERLEDIYISGELDVSKIKCDAEALEESKRLEEVFNQSEKEKHEKRARCIKISFVKTSKFQNVYSVLLFIIIARSKKQNHIDFPFFLT